MKPQLERGLVQVYTGEGKGKTTAALGLAFRALGHGFRVHILQFMKGSSYAGEFLSAQRLFPYLAFSQFGRGCPHSAMIRQGLRKCDGCGDCFIKNKKPREEDYQLAATALTEAGKVIDSGEWDIVILDEIGNAFRYDLIDKSQVINMIRNKPFNTELVLTGRGIPKEILDIADLVTEMRTIKHPYQKGISSRRGIEY